MMAYASRTGTRRNLDALAAAGWGILLSATGSHCLPAGFPYMLDNGRWSLFQMQQGVTPVPFPGYPEECDDLERLIDVRFSQLLERYGAGADMIVIPDRVACPSSLHVSLYWMDCLAELGRPLLLPVQDGMRPEDIRPLLGADIGIFLGGSTEWKLQTMRMWGRLARDVGCRYHVARVNSAQRIEAARQAGATSIDGSSATRYAETVQPLDRARKSPQLCLGGL